MSSKIKIWTDQVVLHTKNNNNNIFRKYLQNLRNERIDFSILSNLVITTFDKLNKPFSPMINFDDVDHVNNNSR